MNAWSNDFYKSIVNNETVFFVHLEPGEEKKIWTLVKTLSVSLSLYPGLFEQPDPGPKGAKRRSKSYLNFLTEDIFWGL